MFIRWQSRRRRSPAFGGGREHDTHWRAILAESVRVDGTPTQRHIAYLGGITESAIEILAQRCHYWDDVSGTLDRLGNRVTTADRERIEIAIAKKVPRPTHDEYMDQARHSAERLGWEFLSKRQKAALQDEAERWQDREGDLKVELKAATAGPSASRCSFCNKVEDQVGVLFTGAAVAGVAICDECVARCAGTPSRPTPK